MGRPEWTENQKLAIDATGGAVLVSAAAGSGKTAVLVERVIDRITNSENPIDADRLLIVTFTRAAANEMKERISARIDELIRQQPHNQALQRQHILLERASISTIHSFCSELIRQNFYRLNISSDFRIADDAELKIIKHNVMTELLNDLYAQADKGFIDFVETFSSIRDDKAIEGIILKLHNFLLSHPFPEQWLNKKAAMYSPDIPVEETVWGSSIIDYARDAVSYCSRLTERSLCIAEQDDALYAKASKQLFIDKGYFEVLSDKLKMGKWNEIALFVSSFENGRLSTPRGYSDDPNKIRISANREILKKVMKTLKGLFVCTAEECTEDIAALSPIVKALFNSVQEFSARFAEKKRELNIADFNDLEHLALKLLVTYDENAPKLTDIALSIRESFDEVMVDEYQDVNEVQDIIFSAVSRNEENLFVVGDVKQSIYRFRQAMPEIFIHRKNGMKLYDKNTNEFPAKIILDKNFRSRSGVTDAVNFVFSHLMSEKAGDINYTEEEKLVAGATYNPNNEATTYLHILDLDTYDCDMNTAEARHIADIIYSNVNSTLIKDGDSERPATFGDFCILLRNANKQSADFVRELTALGIPATADAPENFLSTYEISVMTALLNVLDNPIQDIPLLAVMMSPIYGFTPDDLADIRLKTPNGKLYNAVKNMAQGGNISCKQFLNDLIELRRIAATCPADTLIKIIYERTGFTSIVLSMTNGESRLNNLRLLQEYAKSCEDSGYKGLSSFIGFINKLIMQGNDLPCACNSSANGMNAVRIMSIHRSKGLEFPICIIANLSRNFSDRDKRDDVLLHSELGLGVRRKDRQLMCKYSTMPRNAVRLEIERDERSEELRVLYVAMTRAKEKLIMITSLKNPAKVIGDLSASLTGAEKLAPYTVLNCSSMSDWIISCALMHRSGRILREIAGDPFFIPPSDDPLWDIEIISDNAEVDEEDSPSDETEFAEMPPNTDNEFLQLITQRLNKPYKYAVLHSLPVKVAASALAEKGKEYEYLTVSRPAFMRESGMTPAERGTAIHAFMQFADLNKALASFDDELLRLKNEGFLTEKECNAVDKPLILKFLESDIMQRISRSDKLYREYRFTVKINAKRVDPTLNDELGDETVILQGAVDLAFEENGSIVIVDYKTDNIKEISELKEKYSEQVLLYKEAMEQCTALSVSQCILYSFKLGEYIEV